MFFLVLSLTVALTQAGFVFEEFPSSAIQTHIHSPSAISHQSITHKKHKTLGSGNLKPSLLASSSPTSAVVATQKQIVFPSGDAYIKPLESDTYLVNYSSSSMPLVTYTNKEKTPVISSHTHTTVDRAYAARPIVYHSLPMIKPAPYISYDAFKSSSSRIVTQK